MSLLDRVISLAQDGWQAVFPSKPTLERAVEHLVASVSTMGRRTISRTITALGRAQQDWSADYKLYSRSCWQPKDLYDPILRQGLLLIGEGPLAVAIDDTKLKKTGRSIPHAGWHRDPMSPPFHPNLQWGVRYLQASLLVPHDPVKQVGCRSLPIRFVPAPWVKKPGKNATDDDLAAYRVQQKEQNLSLTGRAMLIELRADLDCLGAQQRRLIVAADGSFCNKALFSQALDRTTLLARTRKDARLCFPARPEDQHRIYSAEVFTPEQVRQDDSIPWTSVDIFYTAQIRSIRHKELSGVLWRRGSGHRPMRLIVIAPQPYRAPNSRTYRAPAYLLTDDLETPAVLLIQIYFDRWQIEVNHREEKSFIGVGDAQLWSALAAPRHPTFQVACYSLILLASIQEFGNTRTDNAYSPLPKWRKQSSRPSILDLLTTLRLDLCNETPGSPSIPRFTGTTFALSAYT